MQIRWIDRFLWVLGPLMLMAGARVAWTTIAALEAESRRPDVDPSLVAAHPTGTTAEVWPLERFSHIWQSDCRRLIDGSAPLSAPPPTMNLTLVGTATDSERPYAILRDSQQHIVVAAIGQRVEGISVMAIARRSVTMEERHQRFELKLTDATPANSATPAANAAAEASTAGRVP